MGLHPLVRTLWVLTLVTALAVAQDDGVLEVPAPETTTVVIIEDPGKGAYFKDDRNFSAFFDPLPPLNAK